MTHPIVKYTVVNGPDHGVTLTTAEAIEDGSFLNMHTFDKFRKCDEDTPIRYASPLQLRRRYHILGNKAYYVGEEFVCSPIIQDAEQVLGPISKKLAATEK